MPHPTVTLNLIDIICEDLENYGHPLPRAWLASPDLTGYATAPDAVQIRMANRHWNRVIGRMNGDSRVVRMHLLDEVSKEQWFSSFHKWVAPYIVQYQLSL